MAKKSDKPVRSVEMVDDKTVITYEDGTVEKLTGPVERSFGNVSGGISMNFGNNR